LTDSPTIQLFRFQVKVEPQQSAVSVPDAPSAGLFVGGGSEIQLHRSPAQSSEFLRIQLARETCVHEAGADNRTIATVNRPFTELS
jgi:hypothetical protein